MSRPSAGAIRGAKRAQALMMRVNRVAERRYTTALTGAFAALHAHMIKALTPIGKTITAGANAKRDAARPASADYRRASKVVLDEALPQVRARATGAHVALEGSLTSTYRATMDRILPITFKSLPANVRAAAEVKRMQSIEYVTDAARDYADAVVTVFESAESTFGLRWEALADQLKAEGLKSASRAELIARDQTGKLNGAINKASQQSAGVTQYKWATTGDDRVRTSHDDVNGNTYDWAGEGAPDIGHPGDDYQCRCTALPILPGDEDYQEPDEA